MKKLFLALLATLVMICSICGVVSLQKTTPSGMQTITANAEEAPVTVEAVGSPTFTESSGEYSMKATSGWYNLKITPSADGILQLTAKGERVEKTGSYFSYSPKDGAYLYQSGSQITSAVSNKILLSNSYAMYSFDVKANTDYYFAFQGGNTSVSSTWGTMSGTATCSIKDITLQVIDLSKMEAATSDGSYYESLETALAETTSGTVTMLKDVTLDSDVTVSSGVELLLPYSSTDTTGYDQNGIDSSTSQAAWNYTNGDGSKKYLYVTLTVPAGKKLTVDGELKVGGMRHSNTNSKSQGQTSGYYAELVNNGTVEVNGTLTINGLVSGDSEAELILNGTAKMSTPFIINDFAGGQNAYSDNNAKHFPFMQLSAQNIWCKQIIYAGAKVSGSGSVFANSQLYTQDFTLIATSSALLNMSAGSVLEITYDRTKTVEISGIDIKDSVKNDTGVSTIKVLTGTVSPGELKISFEINALMSVNASSKEYILPVSYAFNFVIGNGATMAIPSGLTFAMMPGCQAIVEVGGTLNVAGKLYVADGFRNENRSGKRYPYASELTAAGFSASAELIVNGTMNITGTFAGIVQSESNSGMITTTGATLGATGIAFGSGSKYGNNTTSFNLQARIQQSGALVDMEKDKTYHALTTLTDNDTLLETFTMTTVYDGIEANGSSGKQIADGDKVVTVNTTINGAFYEKEGDYYKIPISTSEANGKLQVRVPSAGGASQNVKVNGLQYSITGASGSDGYLGGNDYILVDETGSFTYQTVRADGTALEPSSKTATDEEKFNNTAVVTLNYVLSTVALADDNQYDCANVSTTEHTCAYDVRVRLTYFGGKTEDINYTDEATAAWEGKSGISVSMTIDVSARYPKNVDNDVRAFEITLYHYTDAVLAYAELVDGLSSLTDPAQVVTQAVDARDAWNALTKNATEAEQKFLKRQLDSAYLAIVTEMLAQDISAEFGDATATSVRVQTLEGKEQEVAVTLSYDYDEGKQPYDEASNKLVAKATYEGVYKNTPYQVSGYVYVRARTIEIEVEDKTVEYGQAEAELTYKLTDTPWVTVTVDGVPTELNDSALIKLVRGNANSKNAGSYEITASMNSHYYALGGDVTGTYTITKKAVSVTVNGATSVYGSAVKTLSQADCNVEGILDSDKGQPLFTLSVDGVDANSNAGSYPITLTPTNMNYEYTLQTEYVVTKRTITLTVTEGLGHVYGEKDAALTYTISGGVEGYDYASFITITREEDDSNDVDIVGTYVITAEYEGDDNHYEVTATGVYTISKRTVVLTIKDVTGTYGTVAGLTAEPTGTYGVLEGDTDKVYSLKVYSLSGEEVKITETTSVGTYTITGTILNNPNYNASFTNTNNKATYTVEPYSLNLVIGDCGSGVYTGDLHDLPNNAEKTFQTGVDDEEVTVTLAASEAMVNAGTYAIDATIKGSLSSNYIVASIEKGTYTITPKVIESIQINSITQTYDGKTPVVTTQTYETGVGNETLTLNLTIVDASKDVKEGGYEIKGELAESYKNYDVKEIKSGTYVITAKDLGELKVDDKLSSNQKTYDGEVPKYDSAVYYATGISVDDVGETLEVTLRTKNEGVNAGTYTVTGSFNNGNYTAAIKEGTYTITRRDVTLTVDEELGHVYGATDGALTYSVENAIDGDEFDVVITREEGKNVKVGGYKITATFAGNDNYNACSAEGVYTITPREITINVADQRSVYGDAIVYTAEVTGDVGLVEGDTLNDYLDWNRFSATATVSGARAAADVSNDAGTYYVQASDKASDDNYAIKAIAYNGSEEQTQAKYEITKREITVKIDDKSSVYGATILDLTATVDDLPDGVEWKEVVGLTKEDGIVVKEGGYAITASLLDETNYAFKSEPTPATYTIEKRRITVAIKATESVYGDTINLDATVENYVGDAQENFDWRTIVLLTKTEGENVVEGGYAVTASLLDENNYAFETEPAEGKHTITPRPITVKVDNQTSTYGENLKKPTVSLSGSSSMVKAEEIPTDYVTFEELAIKNADTYEGVIVATDKAKYDNYEVTVENAGTYTIEKRALTVTIGNGNKVYDKEKPDLNGITVTFDGVAYDEDLSTLVTLTEITQTDVKEGGYTIAGTFDGESELGKNYAAVVNAGTYTIQPRAITVTIDNKTSVYGEAIQALSAKVAGGLDGDDWTKYVTLTKADGVDVREGGYSITATLIDGNYEFKDGVAPTGTYAIEKATTTLTVSVHNVMVSAVQNTIITATSSWHQDKNYAQPTLTYALYQIVENEETAVEWNGGYLPSALAIGSYEIVVSYNDTNFNVAEVSATFDVVEDDDYYEVTFNFELTKTYDGDRFDVSNDSITVQIAGTEYEVTDFVIAVTQNGKEAEILNAGTYLITVTVDEVTYTRSYVVSKREITVKVNSAESTYGDSSLAALTATVENGINGKDDWAYYIALEKESGVNAGTYAIKATLIDSVNYKLTSDYADGVYTIKPKAVEATITSATSVYGSDLVTVFKATATGMVGEDDINDYIVLTRADGENKNAGKYLISGVDKATTDNYVVTFADGEVYYTITPRKVTVVIDDKSSVYGDSIATEYTATLSANSSNTLVESDDINEYIVFSVDEALRTGANADTYTIYGADKASNDNYEVSFENDGKATYTITKRAVTLTVAEGLGHVYGATDGALTYSVGNAIDGDEFDVVITRDDGKNVGKYAVTARFAGNTNYNACEAEGVYTITPREITINVADQGSVYGDEVVYTAKITGDVGLVAGDTLNDYLDWTRTALSEAKAAVSNGAGTYSLTATDKNDGDNYDVTIEYEDGESAIYTISKRSITLYLVGGDKTYDGVEYTFGATQTFTKVDNADIVGDDVLTVNVNVQSVVNADVYDITGTASHDDYEITLEKASYEIFTKEIEIKIDTQYSQYGDGLNELTATTEGLVEGESFGNYFVLKTDAEQGSVVGTYPIFVEWKENVAQNYSFDTENTKGSYIVQRREITLTVENGGKTYDGKKPEVTTQTCPTGVGDETLTLNLEIVGASKDVKEGGYELTGTLVNDETSKNYEVKEIKSGKYVITAAPITITINPTGSNYGDPIAELEQTTEGLVEGESFGNYFVLKTDAKQGSVVGTYSIFVEWGDDVAKNYSFDDENTKGVYTVNTRKITVTIGDGGKPYDGNTPNLKDVVNYTVEGVWEGDTLYFNFTGIEATEVGSYTITGYFTVTDKLKNYEVDLREGTYVISKRQVTVLVNDATSTYGDADAALTASVVGEVGFVNGHSWQDVITMSRLEGANVGTYAITAKTKADANKNYDVTVTYTNGTNSVYTITPRKVTVVIDNKSSVYGDAIVTEYTATLNGYTMVGDDRVTDYIVFSVDEALRTGANASTYTIYGVDKATDDNYEVSFENDGKATYTITKRLLTITIGNGEQVYDGKEANLEDIRITFDNALEADKEDLRQYVALTMNGTAVGIHPITGAFEEHQNYSLEDLTDGSYEIKVREITVTINDKTSIYGDDPVPCDGYVSVGSIVEGDTNVYTLKCSVNNRSDVETYAITGEAVNANYEVTFIDGEYVVTARPITVEIDDVNRTYGQTYLAPTAHVSGALNGVNWGACIQLTKAGGVDGEGMNAGHYAITAEIINKNYKFKDDVAPAAGTYTIAPCAVSVTLNKIGVAYGEAVLTSAELATYVPTLDAVLEADRAKTLFTLTAKVEEGAEIGFYNVQAIPVDGNYAFTFTNLNGIYEVTKRQVTLLVNDATSTYGEADGALTASIVGEVGFVNEHSWQDVITMSRLEGANVGTYAITAKTKADANKNYAVTVTYTSGNNSVYTITQRPVTVTVGNVEIAKNAAWATLVEKLHTASVTNLIDGDDLKVSYAVKFNGVTVDESNYAEQIRVGTFTLTAGTDNANYDVTVVDGVLTVTYIKVLVNYTDTQYTYNEGETVFFDWSKHIEGDGDSASVNSFKATLVNAENEVMGEGGLLSIENLPVGTYKLTVAIVHTSEYEWAEAPAEYTVTVGKKDISAWIVPQGFVDGRKMILENGMSVSAAVEVDGAINYYITVQTQLSVGEEIVSTIESAGAYALTATVVDGNYQGSRTFTFNVVEDTIKDEMATLNAMLKAFDYSASSQARYEAVVEIMELAKTLNTDEAKLLIYGDSDDENDNGNADYQRIVREATNCWNAYLASNEADVEIANGIWRKAATIIAATTLLTAAAFIKRTLKL